MVQRRRDTGISTEWNDLEGKLCAATFEPVEHFLRGPVVHDDEMVDLRAQCAERLLEEIDVGVVGNDYGANARGGHVYLCRPPVARQGPTETRYSTITPAAAAPG